MKHQFLVCVGGGSHQQVRKLSKKRKDKAKDKANNKCGFCYYIPCPPTQHTLTHTHQVQKPLTKLT